MFEHIGFINKPYNSETGLSYFGARYYDPLLGRFMGIDPVGFTYKLPISFNRYVYSANNPLRYKDPTGRFLDGPEQIAGLAIGGVVGAINGYQSGGAIGAVKGFGVGLGVGFASSLVSAGLSYSAAEAATAADVTVSATTKAVGNTVADVTGDVTANTAADKIQGKKGSIVTQSTNSVGSLMADDSVSSKSIALGVNMVKQGHYVTGTMTSAYGFAKKTISTYVAGKVVDSVSSKLTSKTKNTTNSNSLNGNSGHGGNGKGPNQGGSMSQNGGFDHGQCHI